MLPLQTQQLHMAVQTTPLVFRAATAGFSLAARTGAAARIGARAASTLRLQSAHTRYTGARSATRMAGPAFFILQSRASLSTMRGGGCVGQVRHTILRSDEKKPSPPAAVTKPEPPKKMTIMEKIKHEAMHYWHGTKLFAKEVKLSSKLVSKVVWGGKLTRREQRQLRRTFTDTVRLVPFLLFVVIPFAELLLPVALKLFPNMLPSTYEDAASAEKKREKMQKVRNEMSRYLKETIAEMGKGKGKEIGHVPSDSSVVDAANASTEEGGKQVQDSIEDTSDFLTKIRSSGEAVSTNDLLRVAHIFEDELTLDNLTRPQLVSICRFMGVNAFGTDNYLRYQITNRMRYIRADDKVIKAEGIDTLSVPELQSACQSRGIRTMGVSPGRMRDELTQWIELHVEHNIPSTLLILSRIIAAGEPMSQQQQFNADALQATINSLPDNLVNEATLRLAEVSGTATPKQKLEVLEEQEELIEDEDEQEKKKKKNEEAAAAAAAATAIEEPTASEIKPEAKADQKSEKQ
ncbi:LETM1 domain-containing protein ylh47 [Coemansia sp. IMI 203386]|nr:LETM1 domain-containing protein ylh47 [Coemansia sp. IMI 203386]